MGFEGFAKERRGMLLQQTKGDQETYKRRKETGIRKHVSRKSSWKTSRIERVRMDWPESIVDSTSIAKSR
jgi:hypothetical protein